MVNVQLFVRPAASIARQVTVVVPMAKVLPLGGVLVTLASEQLSDAVGAKLTTVPAGDVALVTMLAGQVICGGVVSLMTTACNCVTLLPLPSL